EVASALEYLHGQLPPIVHGNLCARNILIDDKGNALLSGFSLSHIDYEEPLKGAIIVEGGQFRYLAPEVHLFDSEKSFHTTPASDCYAFAMTILGLATLDKPFAEYQNEYAAANAAGKNQRPQRPLRESFGALDEAIVDMLWILLTEMWAHNPADRPSMRVVVSRLIAL
ncbi:kinase-like protein, partial [Clavulina sp. PMI_390]